MAESVTITCDSCGERISRSARTKIRWAIRPYRRVPSDLCESCTGKLLKGSKFRPKPVHPMCPGGAA